MNSQLRLGPHLFASPACQLIRSLTSRNDSSSLAWTRSPSADLLVAWDWEWVLGKGFLAHKLHFYSERTLRWSIQMRPLIRPHSSRKLVKGSRQQGHMTDLLTLSLCSRHQEAPVQDPRIGSRTHVCLPGGDDEIDSPNLSLKSPSPELAERFFTTGTTWKPCHIF